MTSKNMNKRVVRRGIDIRTRWTTRKLTLVQPETKTDIQIQWMTMKNRNKNNHLAVKTDERILEKNMTQIDIKITK